MKISEQTGVRVIDGLLIQMFGTLSLLEMNFYTVKTEPIVITGHGVAVLENRRELRDSS